MRAGLSVLLGVVLTAASADGAEPPKKAPANAMPATHETSKGQKSAAKPTDQSHETPEPKAADAASDTKGAEPAAPAKKKVPMVSRAAPPASAAAAHAPADAGHAAVPTAPGQASTAAAHSPAPSASANHGGYVATGARPKAVASSAGKGKPMVSGLAARPADAHAPDSHESPAGPRAVHATPAVSMPPAANRADATPAHEGAGTAPDPAARPGSRGLARLSDVHERIAAALASLKDDAGRTEGRADTHAPAGGDGPGARSRTPRITLRWPAPRWRVMWASLPSSADALRARSAISPPVPSLVAAPAPRLPAPSSVMAQPPDRH